MTVSYPDPLHLDMYVIMPRCNIDYIGLGRILGGPKYVCATIFSIG
jgi:hypothetical protein